ncbi:MAG: recombinase family protein [Methanomassiliicoccales archaeon]
MASLAEVAAYLRVSTEDQAQEGFSIAAQRERLEAYCEAHGWNIVDFYYDNGHSGRSTRRPGYRRMMEERDRWDTILVMKMDRIHRNSKNFMIMMEDLESWGKKFASMQESLDTSNALGRFVVDIIQRIAQLESEQIGERTYMGMREKAESGRAFLGFDPPYGFAYREGALHTIQEESEVVREIYDLYLSGITMDMVARRLNDRMLTTRKGNEWTVWSVRRILHNPVYAGYLRWDGIITEGDHKPVVSVEDFNRVQRAICSRIRNPEHKRCIQVPERLNRPVREEELTGGT